MRKDKNIHMQDYNYLLSEDMIAKYPLNKRDLSKLLVYKKGELKKDIFRQIDQYLTSENLLVYNETKVIQARLLFHKSTGAKIEIFCLEPYHPADYNLSFQQKKEATWSCIVGNLKKWKDAPLFMELQLKNHTFRLKAEKAGKNTDSELVKFSWDHPNISFGEILEHTGKTPIPPYLKREAEDSDKETYQTIYSRWEGSVAAPTAGLHFTEEVFSNLKNKNIERLPVTLHVGAGTFRPVKEDKAHEHEMHSEHFIIAKQSLSELQKAKYITPVGTTSLRTLESIYWLAVKLKNSKSNLETQLGQWEAYDLPQDLSREEALDFLYGYMQQHGLEKIHATTQIMITPGYSFRMTDSLITNFHQPKSTLLLLIAALIGEDWKKVYHYAKENNFRFLSYGDSSLLIP